MVTEEHALADRLGKTVHVSPLRMKLAGLTRLFPSATAACLEDWLVDVANDRGARVVFRQARPADAHIDIPQDRLSNEDLVVGICQLQCLDRPHMLRLAAQLISRRTVDPMRLCRVARRERAGAVLAELARQALHIDPGHSVWRAIADCFAHERALRDTLLHWTRLAEPVMKQGRCDAEAWNLVA